MHAHRQRPVLDLIPKGIFHFIPVAELPGTGLDPLKDRIRIRNHFPHQGQYLGGFQLQLLFIRQRLVIAASADAEMGTVGGFLLQGDFSRICSRCPSAFPFRFFLTEKQIFWPGMVFFTVTGQSSAYPKPGCNRLSPSARPDSWR